MTAYKNMSKAELEALKSQLEAEFENVKGLGLKLDMSRGKPGTDQLELSMPMLEILDSDAEFKGIDSVDFRNYGLVDGTTEAKQFFAELMEVDMDHVAVFGNSSLNIAYDLIARAFISGYCGHTPWRRLDTIKWLCPVPGYDRHFAITEHFGIEMINIPMDENGPDMDLVEQYVNNDESVKGIWCIPKYSNPSGAVYSDEVIKRFANLKPAAKDFRIFWDNAYCVHHLYERVNIANIAAECEKAGNPDLYFELCSTSKITFPGAGVAAMIASPANLADLKKSLTVQTISYDKMNQMRHVRFLKNPEGVYAHMEKHAEILRPKFEAALDTLEKELGGLEIGTWLAPKGGYFIAFDTLEGCAKKVIDMCKEAGVTMTPPGSTYPYHKDAKDTSIRIAPTFPTPGELEKACKVFVLCVKYISAEKLLETK